MNNQDSETIISVSKEIADAYSGLSDTLGLGLNTKAMCTFQLSGPDANGIVSNHKKAWHMACPGCQSFLPVILKTEFFPATDLVSQKISWNIYCPACPRITVVHPPETTENPKKRSPYSKNHQPSVASVHIALHHSGVMRTRRG